MSQNHVQLSLGIAGIPQVTGGISQVETAVHGLGGKAQTATGRMAAGMAQAGTASGRMAESVIASNARTEQSFISLRTVIGTVGLAYLARESIQYADSQTLLSSRIALVAESEAELVATRKELYDISQDTRSALGATADLYSRIARNSEDLGLAQVELLRITESVNKTITISGGSAAGAQAALIQLGQAMASGVLRGEELNSVLEQAPRLAEAIAVGMGKSIGELRRLGADGELTAQAVVQALLTQSEAIDREYGKIAMTVGQAFTMLDNAVGSYVGGADRARGASATFAGGVAWVSEHIDEVGDTVVLVGGLILTRYVSSLAVAGAATVARTAQMAANWWTVHTAVATTTYRLGAMGERIIVSTGQAAASVGLLRGALGLMGGPIGVITTLLGVGATAWALWGSRASQAADDAKRATDSIIEDLERQTQAMVRGSGFAAAEAEKRLAELQKEQKRLSMVITAGGLGENAPVAQQYVQNAQEIIRLTGAIERFQTATENALGAAGDKSAAQVAALAKVEAAITLQQANELQKRLLAVDKWAAEQRKVLLEAGVAEGDVQAAMVAVYEAAQQQKTQIAAEEEDKRAQAALEKATAFETLMAAQVAALAKVEAAITLQQANELQKRLLAVDKWAAEQRKILLEAGVAEGDVQTAMVAVYEAAQQQKTQIAAEEEDKRAQAALEKATAFETLMAEINGVSFDSPGVTFFGDPLTDGIGNAVEAMNRLNRAHQEEQKNLQKTAALRQIVDEKYAEGTAERAQALEALAAREQREADEAIQSQLAGYRELFGTTSELFDEQSKEREALHNLELAFAAVEIALQLKKSAVEIGALFQKQAVTQVTNATEIAGNSAKAVSAATVAVATQGSGDPYTAFGRIAAMAALMAGVLGAAGIGFGGDRSGSAPPAAAPGTGTVFGDSEAVSESASKGYDLLEEIHASEYAELRGIHRSMRELNTNIRGLVGNIVRNFGTFDDSQWDITTGEVDSLTWEVTDTVGGFISDLFGEVDGFFTGFLGDSTLGEIIGGLATSGSAGAITNMDWVNKGNAEIWDAVLGGGTETTILASGLSIGENNIGDILAGADAVIQAYAYIKTKTDGGLFGSTKREYSTKYQEVDEGVTDLFTNIFANLGETMFGLSQALGVDVAEKINAYVIDIGLLDLQDKTGEEIAEILSGVISAAGDQMAQDLFGEIVAEYQQLNEGLLETMVRLVAEQAVVRDAVERSGLSIESNALDISQALIELAGGLDNFRDAFAAYSDNFFTDAEKQQYLQDRLTVAMGEMNMILPGSREGYRALVEALALSNESDQQRYVQLLQLSEAADQYYEALEEGAEEAFSSLRRQIAQALDVAGNAAATLRDILFSDIGNTSPERLYAERMRAFEEAQLAGRDAELPALGRSLLEASRAYNASGAGYQTDFERVTAALGEIAGIDGAPTLSAAERQVQLLNDIRQAIEDENLAQLNLLAGQTELMRELLRQYLTSQGETPSFAVGSAYVPYDMRADIHQGEMILDANFAASLRRYGIPAGGGGGDNRELIAEVKALRAEMAELKGHAAAGVRVQQAGFTRLIDTGEKGAAAQREMAGQQRLANSA